MGSSSSKVKVLPNILNRAKIDLIPVPPIHSPSVTKVTSTRTPSSTSDPTHSSDSFTNSSDASINNQQPLDMSDPEKQQNIINYFQSLKITQQTHPTDMNLNNMTRILSAREKQNTKELLTMKERIKAKKFTVQDLNQFYALHRNSVGKIVDKEDIRLRYGFSKDEYDSLLMFFNTPQVNDTSNGTSSTSTGSLKSVWVEN